MAAGNTYIAIATQTLGSSATSVTFSSIPGTYTDLIIVTSALSPGGGNNSRGYRFELNSDTATNYSQTWLANGTSSRESSQTRGRIGGISETANDVTTVLTTFLNYSNTTTYKTVLSKSSNLNTNNDTNVFAGVSLWRSTSAITSIRLFSGANIFGTGTTATLYGIKNA
jgi:hypothetical protein